MQGIQFGRLTAQVHSNASSGLPLPDNYVSVIVQSTGSEDEVTREWQRYGDVLRKGVRMYGGSPNTLQIDTFQSGDSTYFMSTIGGLGNHVPATQKQVDQLYEVFQTMEGATEADQRALETNDRQTLLTHLKAYVRELNQNFNLSLVFPGEQ